MTLLSLFKFIFRKTEYCRLIGSVISRNESEHIFSGKTKKYLIIITEINHFPGPEVIKLFSCSTQLSMKFSLLIYMLKCQQLLAF